MRTLFQISLRVWMFVCAVCASIADDAAPPPKFPTVEGQTLVAGIPATPEAIAKVREFLRQLKVPCAIAGTRLQGVYVPTDKALFVMKAMKEAPELKDVSIIYSKYLEALAEEKSPTPKDP